VWEEKDILIIIKTYPEISIRHTETVCTGGILAENMKMVRLYPIPFRYLDGDQQFKIFQWLRAKIRKNTRDSRPESYNIDDKSIQLRHTISSRDWNERRKWVLSESNIYKSLEAIKSANEQYGTSMGIIKPKKIEDFRILNRSDTDQREIDTKKNQS
jgi:hypothetical protein